MSQQITARNVDVGRAETVIRKQTYIMSQIRDVQSKICQEFQIIKINEQKYNLFFTKHFRHANKNKRQGFSRVKIENQLGITAQNKTKELSVSGNIDAGPKQVMTV